MHFRKPGAVSHSLNSTCVLGAEMIPTTLVWSMVSIIQGRLSRTPGHLSWFAVHSPIKQILEFFPGVVTSAQLSLRVAAHHVQPRPTTAREELNITLRQLIVLHRLFRALIIRCILDNHYQTYHSRPQRGVLRRVQLTLPNRVLLGPVILHD